MRSSRNSRSSKFVVDDAAMAEREAEMGDARVEVVSEALHRRRQLPLVRLHEVIAQHRSQRRARRLVAAPRPQDNLRPPALGGFAPKIAEPMHEAALAERPREARLRPRGSAQAPRRWRRAADRPTRGALKL